MSEQNVSPAANQNDAQTNMDEQIRQAVIAWLADVFERGDYRLGSVGNAGAGRDRFLELTNHTNLNLRQLQVQMELYKGTQKVDTVTAKTTASGIEAGQTGRLNFFSQEVNFTGLKVLPDTATYKADWVPDQPLGKEKKGFFAARREKKQKKTISQAFSVGSGQKPGGGQNIGAGQEAEGNVYVQRLAQLQSQITREEDADIRQGLAQLTPILESIFQRVAEVPGSEDEIKRLTDRYLPMITGPTEAYLDYASRNVTGEEMAGLKEDVRSGIRMVTEACTNLRNRLYEDGIVDASTDISALKMLLQQDGLLDSAFDRRDK